MGCCPDFWLCAFTILLVRLRSAESHQVSRMRETEEFGIARTGVGRCENDSRFAIKAAWCKKLAFFSRSANMLQEVRPTFRMNSRVPRKRKRGIYFFRLDQFREIVRNCIFEAAHPVGNALGAEMFHRLPHCSKAAFKVHPPLGTCLTIQARNAWLTGFSSLPSGTTR